MKKLLLCLMVFLLTVSFALADTLPAPWTTGVYAGAQEIDGVTYQIYVYEMAKPSSSSSVFMSVYKGSAERAGYEVIELEEMHSGSGFGIQTDWYAVVDDEWIAFLCEESGYFTTKSTITLLVPEGMDFDPNPEKETTVPGTTFTFSDGTTYTFDFSDFTFQNPSFFN